MKSFLRKSVNVLPGQVRFWIKYIPGVAIAQRWLVNQVISGESFVHSINAGPASGLLVDVTLPQDKAIWAGTFEPEFSQLLHDSVRHGDVCYDIGGYRGFMSGVLALAGANRVIIFEPLADNVAHLKRLAELNPLLPFQIEAKAVGKHDGEICFKVMPDQSMGKIADSTFQTDCLSLFEIPVLIARLDTCIYESGLPRPDLLKIDVEGAEVDVLEGAERVLKECRPRILIEAHSELLADLCTKKLRNVNYNVSQLEHGTLESWQARHLFAEPSNA